MNDEVRSRLKEYQRSPLSEGHRRRFDKAQIRERNMESNFTSLRPASSLREEHNSRSESNKQKNFIRELNEVAGKIEAAHRDRQTSVTVLSVSEEVCALLMDSGYKVKFQRACGMGDMDSHKIDWS